jgi:hypothetical protein
LPKLFNARNHRFNRWLVLDKDPVKQNKRTFWHCRCDCGTERLVDICTLRGKTTKSCGCVKLASIKARAASRTDILGQKFGLLTAIRRGESRTSGDSRNISTWECECACGSIRSYFTSSLRSGNSTSCGCRAIATAASRVQSMAFLEGQVYCSYRATSKRRGRSFNLSKEQTREIIFKDCHYCDKPPSNIWRSRNRKHTLPIDLVYNGIDRVDNSRGYDFDNVVPCCRECNTIKHDSLSYDEMKAVAQCLKDYRSRQNGLRLPQP